MEVAEVVVILDEIDIILTKLVKAKGRNLHTLLNRYCKLYSQVEEEFVPNHPNFNCDEAYARLSEANQLLLRSIYYKPRVKYKSYDY